MGSLLAENQKPHAVCVPFPAQGHINPMLKLAKLLHQKGFYITFVNSEFNHQRLLKSRGPDSVSGLPSFRFETIPDGLPPSDEDATQHVPSLCDSTKRTCLAPFKAILSKLNDASASNANPPVTCIVSDLVMSFSLEAAQEFGIPNVLFWTASACGFMAYSNYRSLAEKGFCPLKDESYLTNGYLETPIDWIPGMEGIRLKHLPSLVRSTDPDDIVFNFVIAEVENARNASAVIFNTFDDLEHEVLKHLAHILPPIFTVGPLQLLQEQFPTAGTLKSLKSNLWKEDPGCLEWLDSKERGSVVYVNFGSVTVMTPHQLIEFAWGLADSKVTFLWIIRPDLVIGDTAILPQEFVGETKERALLASWCPQEEVLKHPSIGGFLTHSGWNSTLESLCGGVPMICWPFYAEQQTNTWFCCNKWAIGMEIDNEVKRDEIETHVRELMEGQKGEAMRMQAKEWKRLAEGSTSCSDGSSYLNFNKMIGQALLSPPHAHDQDKKNASGSEEGTHTDFHIPT